jgi:hypothetical protein
MAAISEHTGGVRWGDSFWLASCATWPFAHLLICDDRLLLTYPEGAYDFPRDQITQLTTRRGLFSRGLRIEHRVAEYPPYITFWTFAFQTLYDALTGAGFPVKT